MDTNVPDISLQPSRKENGLTRILSGIVGILIGLASLLIVLLILNYFNIISLQQFFPKQLGFLPHRPITSTSTVNSNAPTADNQNAVIEKVGDESLYQGDLDTELSGYPVTTTVDDAKKQLLQKMTKDSIILQEGQKEGLIHLDSTVFNSPDKDYEKRIALVTQVENMIKNRQDSVSGSVVSIWFFNDKAGTVGYDKGKQIAHSTITPLYDQVKSKKITIQHAAQQIQNDAGLAQVDKQYKSNAIFAFNAGPSDKISFDPTFDTMIRKLRSGQLTSLYLAKDKNLSTGQMIDAVYMFAEVSDRKSSGHPEDFDQWYAQVQKKYAVTLY